MFDELCVVIFILFVIILIGYGIYDGNIVWFNFCGFDIDVEIFVMVLLGMFCFLVIVNCGVVSVLFFSGLLVKGWIIIILMKSGFE